MTSRLRRLREDDSGFALVFAMMVTTVVVIMTAAVLTVLRPGISGAKNSQDVVAATVAARSGIDDAIAYLMSNPACRSESQICLAATQIGDDKSKAVTTDNLAAAGKPRPALTGTSTYKAPFAATKQTFSWAIGQTPTPEGFLRVTSTGTYDNVQRTLVADLALNASILKYGYYSDYESFSPQFLRNYYKPRSVYLSDPSIYANVASSNRGSTTVPRFVNWRSPSAASAGNCGQHWYYESPSSPGRKQNGSSFSETGTLGSTTSTTSGTAVSRDGGCDLVFSSSMKQNGMTFTRDAILSSGSGPVFNQRVFTMWGYKNAAKDYTNPAFDAAGKFYRGDVMTSTSKFPEIAPADVVLRPNIGKDGIPANACVYEGPTRVKLTGDGWATVTSPATRTATRTRYPQSPDGCYPADLSTGVVGQRVNYANVGSGAIVVRNLGAAPATGWPVNGTLSSQAPGPGNEVFYFNAPGSTDVVQHGDKSASAYSGCSSTTKYSPAVDATCAWTTVGVTTEGSGSLGWTSYAKTTCGSAAATNRQLFECEYAKSSSSASPATSQAAGQYKVLRDLVQTELAKGTCLNGTVATQAGCVNAIVQSQLNAANSTSTVDGAHRYVATTTDGTATNSVVATGVTGSGATGTTSDSFFTQPTPASETLTRTPLTTTVTRQVYDSSSRTWGSATTAFKLTTTQSDYTYTGARGMTYFPNEADVTDYSVGVDKTGATARRTGETQQAGDRQPGDLYIEGNNKGKLSVLAENDVVVTGDITNPATYSPATDAVSLTAEQDVRNYHPVTCADQDKTDINNTTPGWCPNDITGLSTSSFISSGSYTSAAPAEQYVNMQDAGPRTIQAAVFALSGSFGTDNYNRGRAVGNLNVKGGLYQSRRGGNGVVSGSTQLSGTNLQYAFEDLARSELPYVPPSTTGLDVRPWNVVSVSPGTPPK